MGMRGSCFLICLFAGGTAYSGEEDPLAQLELIRANAYAHLDRLEQCVCRQSVERFQRAAASEGWKPLDRLDLDVALAGGEERYGKAGAARFFRTGLSDAAGGVTSTGRYGLLLRQVLDPKTAAYRAKGLSERNGRPALEFEFEVLQPVSTYRLRAGTMEKAVGYEGVFWADAATFELIRLEAHAIDIPQELGLADARFHVEYGPLDHAGESFLVPLTARIELATTDGLESLNRTRLVSCRKYQAESNLQFTAEAAPAPAPNLPQRRLPPGAVLEVTLDESVPLGAVSPGHAIKARLTRPVHDGETVVLPEGAVVAARIVAVERQSVPAPVLEIGLALSHVEAGDGPLPLSATMLQADSAKGLLQQQKRFMPSISEKGKTRSGILVRRVEQGQGILQWDPASANIPRGFKTRWRIDEQ